MLIFIIYIFISYTSTTSTTTTQVEVTLDAYLDGKLWSSIQKDCYPKKKAAREVDMVSRHGGIIRRLTGDAFIRSLASFRSLTWDVKPGDYISKVRIVGLGWGFVECMYKCMYI